MKPESKKKIDDMCIEALEIMREELKHKHDSFQDYIDAAERYFQSKIKECPQEKTIVQAAARRFETILEEEIEKIIKDD